MINKYFLFLNFLLIITINLNAQNQSTGRVEGIIIDKTSNTLLEFANVSILKKSDGTLIKNTITNKEGIFFLDELPFGDYLVVHSFIGFDKAEPIEITVKNY